MFLRLAVLLFSLAIACQSLILDDTKKFLPCDLVESTIISDTRFDSVVLVTHDIDQLNLNETYGSTLKANIVMFLEVLSFQKTVLVQTSQIALKTGSRAPLMIVQENSRYPTARLSSMMAALAALYTPLEIREHKGQSSQKAKLLGVYAKYRGEAGKVMEKAAGVEAGRFLAKDICGSDPIRMTPPKVAKHVGESFQGFSNSVRVQVISDQERIEKDYPLLDAVNRASKNTPQYQARVIWLEYTGAGPITDTVMLVGKGVTLDIGGLNIKTGGGMYSMSRDKCGAAAVAGFFKVLDALKPRGLKAVGVMAMVRNNIGPEAYSCDEIITTRAGKRVRVVNTDAEGRMAMMDPLFEMKQRALNETNPQIYTIATLTGHAMKTVGSGYTIVLDNGPAKEARNAFTLQDSGDAIGDMIEISTIRREDYKAHKSETEYEDLLQSSGTGSSSKRARGHQNPTAFLIMGSGLDGHGTDSKRPLKYSHLDMAATANFAEFPEIPPGSPVAALAARHVLNRLN